MRLIITILLFLTSINGVAQNFSEEEQYQIDSLNAIIENSNSHDTSLVDSYIALSEILYVSNMDTLRNLCEKAKVIAEKALNDNPPTETKKSLLTSLTEALNNIGFAYKHQEDVPKALEYYHISLGIREEIGDKKGVVKKKVNGMDEEISH